MKQDSSHTTDNNHNKRFNLILNSLIAVLIIVIILAVVKGDFNMFKISSSPTKTTAEQVKVKEVETEMTYSEFGQKSSKELMEKIKQKDFPRIYDEASDLLKTQVDKNSFINVMGSYTEWIGDIDTYRLSNSYMHNDLLVQKVFKNSTGKALYAYEYEILNKNKAKFYITLYYQQIERDMKFCFAYMSVDEIQAFNKEIGAENIKKIDLLINNVISYYNEGKMKDLYKLMSKENQKIFTENSLHGLFDEQNEALGKISKATYKTFDTALYPPILLLQYDCSTEKKKTAVLTFAVVNQEGEWKLLDFKEKK